MAAAVVEDAGDEEKGKHVVHNVNTYMCKCTNYRCIKIEFLDKYKLYVYCGKREIQKASMSEKITELRRGRL